MYLNFKESGGFENVPIEGDPTNPEGDPLTLDNLGNLTFAEASENQQPAPRAESVGASQSAEDEYTDLEQPVPEPVFEEDFEPSGVEASTSERSAEVNVAEAPRPSYEEIGRERVAAAKQRVGNFKQSLVSGGSRLWEKMKSFGGSAKAVGERMLYATAAAPEAIRDARAAVNRGGERLGNEVVGRTSAAYERVATRLGEGRDRFIGRAQEAADRLADRVDAAQAAFDARTNKIKTAWQSWSRATAAAKAARKEFFSSLA